MAHRHRQRRIGPLLRRQPGIGELGRLAVVGRHHDGLGAFVAHLREEVSIRRARLRNVRPPQDEEVGVVPIGALRDVRLLAPGLRRRRRQIAVPVVEAHADAADQGQVARAGRVGDHGHGRDRREADDPVGTVRLDGMDIGRGDYFLDLVPARANESAQAAHALVGRRRLGVVDDRLPREHRIVVTGLGVAPKP